MPKKETITATLEKGNPFGPDFDNRVQGEVLVKLTRDGELSVTESIPAGPLRRAAVPPPTTFGIGSLDRAMAELGVKSITKVHGPFSNATMADSGAGLLGGREGAAHTPGMIMRQPVQHRVGMLAEELGSTYRLRIDPATDLDKAVKKLAGVEVVMEASPNYFRFSLVTTPNDPMYATQWGLVKINCPAAWDRTKGIASVVVGVVDTGVDLDHPDLQGNLVAGYDMVDMVGVSPSPGWHFEGDFLTRDDTPQDEVGHGTHVAGTIAALSNNAIGVAGVTWNCKIMPLRVLARMVQNTTGAVTGVGTAVDIAAGIRYAVDHGAHIINLSLGGYNDTFVERDAVAYAISKGIVVVAAMGNDNTSNPSYPGAYPDVVAVGAINQSEQRAPFSNTGPHIDLAAPGVGIRSTVWDNTYADYSGTSMATPHVAGVAALVKSCKFSLTGAQIAQILRDTAKPLKDNPGDPVPNDYYGYGLVDAKAAIDRACPVIKLKFADEPGGWKKIFDDHKPYKKLLDDKPPKLKILDEGGPKLKAIDDPMPKQPGLDPGLPQPQPGMPAPFVLATPHHSMAWTTSQPASDYETRLANYASAIAALEEVGQKGGLTEAGGQQLEGLRQEYQALLAEYQQMCHQGQ